MKRILSGIKPSGDITLGNYLGAMRRWADLSKSNDAEHFFFVPNLHALTERQEPAKLEKSTRSAVAWLIAIGVDPERTAIYVQSQIPEHAELNWILDNYVTMGELNRMTQFKDKSRKSGPEGQLVGLYGYPVLMAADILLYDADEVPVGEDQKQHVELARDIASRFNNLYGQTFKLPTATIPEEGARIMNLQNPTAKMSKSDTDDSGNILMTDSKDQIERKITRAVTDSGSDIKKSNEQPAISNLLQIYSLMSDQHVGEIESKYKSKGYAEFKADLAKVVQDVVLPIQEKHDSLMADKSKIDQILEEGRQKATKIAEPKLASVKQKLGLL